MSENNYSDRPPPKLLDQLRAKCRLLHYSIRTEEAYVGWCTKFILFHEKRHPKEMGVPEIERFLSHLATERRVAASTQNQAFSAILFRDGSNLGSVFIFSYLSYSGSRRSLACVTSTGNDCVSW